MTPTFKAKSELHFADIRACVALGSYAIGLALEENTNHLYFITWGRNMTPKQCEKFQEITYYDVIECSNGFYEAVIPDKEIPLIFNRTDLKKLFRD